MRLKARCSLLVPVLVVPLLAGAVAACDGKRMVEPGSTGSPPASLSTMQVRVEGQVADSDNDAPLGRAVVRAVRIVDPEHSRVVNDPAWSATSDESGRFSFAADVPANWTQLILSVNRDGYEDRQGFFARSSSGAYLPLFPRLTIRPGQSIQVRVDANLYNCFDDGVPCRRVVVESPSGEFVDLTVTNTIDSNAGAGLDGFAETHTIAPPRWMRQLTVSGGEVWVYGSTPGEERPVRGQLTLTATRH